MATDKSLLFDGIRTAIALGTLAPLGLSTTSFTVEAWFSIRSDNPEGGTLLWLEAPGEPASTLHIRIASDVLVATLTGVSEPVEVTPLYPGWHHLALFYARNGGVLSVRVNGVHEVRVGTAVELPETTTLHIGAEPDGHAWKGQLSELRVWSVVRSSDQVLGLMHRRLSGMEPNLVCYLPLDLAGPDATSVARDAKKELDPKTREPTSTTLPGKPIIDGAQGELGVPLHALSEDEPGAPKSVVVGDFDGRVSVVNAPHTDVLASIQEVTVEAWARPTSISKSLSSCPVVSTRGEAAGWELRAGAGYASFLVHVDGEAIEVSTPLTPGHWVHLAGLYDGARVVLYVNGVALASTDATGERTDAGMPLELGRSSADAERCFAGQLSEVRVWSVARSQAELQRDVHKRLTDDVPGLVARCSLEAEVRDTTTNKLPWSASGVRWVGSTVPLERSTDSALAVAAANEPFVLQANREKLIKQGQKLTDEKTELERKLAELEQATKQPTPAIRRPAVTPEVPSVVEAVPNMPIGELVRSMATAIADAQFSLDKSSLMVSEFMSGHYPLRDQKTGDLVDEQGQGVTQPVMVDSRVYFGHHIENGKRVPNLVSMMELGFVPNFYQFVDTVLEVKIAMKLERQKTAVDPRTGRVINSRGRANDVRLSTTPVDAGYAASYNYNVDQSSVFKTKLVCVPPPVVLEERLREVMQQEAQAAAAGGSSTVPSEGSP